MPYKVEKRDDKWTIIKTDTNETVGHSDTKADAESSIKARLASEHEAKFCNTDIEEFAEQCNITYVDAYRVFEAVKANTLEAYADKDDVTWITVGGRHIPIKEGETQTEGQLRNKSDLHGLNMKLADAQRNSDEEKVKEIKDQMKSLGWKAPTTRGTKLTTVKVKDLKPGDIVDVQGKQVPVESVDLDIDTGDYEVGFKGRSSVFLRGNGKVDAYPRNPRKPTGIEKSLPKGDQDEGWEKDVK